MDSLWRSPDYRRLWTSLFASALAGQIATLTLSLTAATVVHATPTQMGVLGAAGTIPFVLFMLPAGVWLDRVRKLPAYIAGQAAAAATLLCIPLALVAGALNIELLYAVAFVSASISVIAGTAGQIVITQVADRAHWIEAHGKSRVAASAAEIAGPGVAGMLIHLAGVGFSALVGCILMLGSILPLRRLRIAEKTGAGQDEAFWAQLVEGIAFVRRDRLLLSMALIVGGWQIFQTCAMATQVLFATRELGMDEAAYGLSMTAAGVATLAFASWSHRVSRHIGAGSAILAGIAVSAAGWLQLAWAPAGAIGVGAFVLMLACYGTAVTLIFSNMLALRQAITPAPMLARMTSTMRWLTLFPAWPGMLLGGLLGEYAGLRIPLLVGGIGAAGLAFGAWRFSRLKDVKAL